MFPDAWPLPIQSTFLESPAHLKRMLTKEDIFAHLFPSIFCKNTLDYFEITSRYLSRKSIMTGTEERKWAKKIFSSGILFFFLNEVVAKLNEKCTYLMLNVERREVQMNIVICRIFNGIFVGISPSIKPREFRELRQWHVTVVIESFRHTLDRIAETRSKFPCCHQFSKYGQI